MAFVEEAKQLLAKVAPVIGTALGGPLGGVATKFLADKLTGGDPGALEDYIVAGSPENVVALRQAELDFKKFIQELGIRESQLEVQDRADARSLAKERGLLVQASLSALYTAGFFLTLLLFISGHVNPPPEYKEMVTMLLGALTAPQIQILNFWFGSSRGSARKTDMMAQSTPKADS